jgi:hypothetical protein
LSLICNHVGGERDSTAGLTWRTVAIPSGGYADLAGAAIVSD